MANICSVGLHMEFRYKKEKEAFRKAFQQKRPWPSPWSFARCGAADRDSYLRYAVDGLLRSA